MIVLRKKSETTTTITLEWDAVPGAVGYRFQSAVTQPKWSHTFDPARTEVKFSKTAWYKVEALGTKDEGRYPVVNPDPPVGKPIPTNGVITAGGTYTGSRTAGTPPALIFDTQEPVVMVGSTFVKTAGGDMFRGLDGGYDIGDVTFDHCRFDGKEGRVLDAEHFKRIVVRNCTGNKTGGFKATNTSGATVIFEKNKWRNILGPSHGTPLSALLKLGNVDASNIEIAWNEYIGEPEVSECEDILSIMRTPHARIHDNYLQGQYAPGNGEGSGSYNGVTFEMGSPDEPECYDIDVLDNQLVCTMGGVSIFHGMHDFRVHRNRVVRSGLYPDGQTRILIGYSAMLIANSAGANCHMHDNVVGWVQGSKYGSGREDWEFQAGGWGHTPAQEDALNTHMPDPITLAVEQAEYPRWQQKLAANGITIGA